MSTFLTLEECTKLVEARDALKLIETRAGHVLRDQPGYEGKEIELGRTAEAANAATHHIDNLMIEISAYLECENVARVIR